MSEFDKKQIFVANLSPKTTNARLSAAFSAYGHVVQAHVQQEKNCGFVTFANEASVTNLLTNVMAGTLTIHVDGVFVTPKPKIIKVNKTSPNAASQSPDLNPKEVFVGGLTPSTTKADIDNYFSKWGLVVNSWILSQKNVAFVTFKHASDAQQLLMKTMNGHVHVIKNRNVTVRPSVGKKDAPVTKSAMKPQPTRAPPMKSTEKRNSAAKPKQDNGELQGLKAKCYELEKENEKLENEKKTLQSKLFNTG